MNEDNKLLEREENFLEVINSAIESIAVYKAMYSLVDKYRNNNGFITLLNSSAMFAIIRLSNIYGTNKEENHWKKIFTDDEDLFRQKVIHKVFKDNYNEYQNNLTNIRNNYIIHYNIGEEKIKNNGKLLTIPDLNISYELLKKTLLFFLDYFEYTNTDNAEKEIEDFYNVTYDKVICLFK